MKISNHRRHLFPAHLVRKRRHHPFAFHQHLLNIGIGSRLPAWQLSLVKHSMQIRRNLFQSQVIFLVAVRAPHVINPLSLRLLRSKRRLAPAPSQRQNHPRNHHKKRPNIRWGRNHRQVKSVTGQQENRLDHPCQPLITILGARPGYPSHMQLPTRDEIRSARALVYRFMPPTPQYTWPLLNQRLGTEAWVKHENHTQSGAFKIRGGLVYLNWLKDQRPSLTGVVAATRGNHGQGIALAAGFLGLKAVIVVPHGNSPEKNAAMQAQGVELIEHGHDFQASLEYARTLAAERFFEFVDSFHPQLVLATAGYAMEFFESAPPIQTIYVPVGMGSSICGVAAARNALGLSTEIVGVVAEQAPAAAISFRERKVVEAPANSIADGLACRRPNPEALEVMLANVARFVQVSETEITNAMRAYYTDTHNLAEGAGAAPLAAALQQKDQFHNHRIGLVLTGGNVDREVFANILTAAENPHAHSLTEPA